MVPMSVQHPIYDLLIVGGGINGAGIARDAAGQGISVLLAEKDFLNFEAGLVESWYNLRRAGASYIITYGARLARGLGL